jgi:hypothetical protein
MLRIYGDSDDTLIVEHTDRPPKKVIPGARYDGSDLVLANYVLYDDELFDVDHAVYEVADPDTGSSAKLHTTWGSRQLETYDGPTGCRYYRFYGRIPEGWTYTIEDVQSERNERNWFYEMHLVGPGVNTTVRRIA